jgi:RNA polymerase sigma-70 factor (ECF subfamily)
MNQSRPSRNNQDEMDDQALLVAAGQGDESALKALFDRHAPWVAGRLRRVLAPDAVEDVVQETFIAVWRGARSYAGGGEVGAWIWGIARRQAALWARKYGRVEPALDVTAAPDPESTAANRADLERALTSLGPGEDEGRELIRLIYVEDRPVAEVARLQSVPPGTVKSRLFNLRRRLRASLSGSQS